MIRFVIVILLACLTVSPLAVTASGAESSPETVGFMGTFAPKVGVWSEYALYDKNTGKRTVMRMSIVGVENDSFWYEIIIREEGRINIVKMMIKDDPHEPENIKRIIVKSDTKPAQELDAESVKSLRMNASRMFEHRSGIPAETNVSMKDMETGEGVATVPAGTFEVRLHQITDTAGVEYAEYKYSQEVRPFGIVSSETESTTMVLVGQGTDAESLISEEPEKRNQSPVISEEMFKDMMTPQGKKAESGNHIRQIPGMGTGYESKQ